MLDDLGTRLEGDPGIRLRAPIRERLGPDAVRAVRLVALERRRIG